MEQQNHSSCSENNGALPLMGPLAAQSQANDVGTRRALIIDKRAVMGTEISRSLARRGYAVDVLGEVGSPAFYSRFCARRIVAPRWEASQRFLNLLHETVRTTK